MNQIIGTKFTVIEDDNKFITVQHPGSVGILPFLDNPFSENPRVVLVKQKRPISRTININAAMVDTIELPAGILDKKDETPINCAIRELIEETGYECKKTIYLGSFNPSPGYTTETNYMFAGYDLFKSNRYINDIGEHTEPIIFTINECYDMIYGSDLIDAKTIVALLMWHKFKNNYEKYAQ